MKSFICILIFAALLHSLPCFGQPGPWQQTNGPTGGNIIDIVFHPDGGVFAGTDAGIYLSTNQGISWELRVLSTPSSSVTAMTIDTSGVIYCATDAGTLKSSTDKGGTWAQIPGVHGNGPTDMLAESDGHLWVCYNGGGLHRTSDRGAHWESLDSGFTSVSMQCLLPEKSGFMFAATLDAGVFRSSDHGKSWQQKSSGISTMEIQALTRHSQAGIFAATWNGMFQSTDAGDHWTRVDTHPVVTVIVDSSDGIFAGGTEGTIYRSTDRGASWSSGSITPTIQIKCLAARKSGAMFAGTLGSGVYWSTDGGGTWLARTTGIHASMVSALVSANDSTVYAALWGSDLVRTTNGGVEWTSVPTSPGNYKFTNLAVDDSGRVLACSWGYGILRQPAGGLLWSTISWGYFYVLVTAPKGVILAGNDVGRVWQSSNYGQTWRQDSVTHYGIAAIAVGGGGFLYAGATPGGVFRSSDKGATWVPKSSGMTDPYVRALYVDPTGVIFAGTDGGLFRSADSAESWTRVATPLVSIRSLLVKGPNSMYAGGWGGIAYSSDGGASWATAGQGLWAPEVRSLVMDAHGNVYAGTPGAGVFVQKSVTGFVRGGLDLPLSAKLEQNYPNPFNPSTTIRYGLPTRSYLTLTVFNTLGQQIAELVNGEMEAGYHDVKFGGSALSSGVYFYRLQAGNFVETRKLLIVR